MAAVETVRHQVAIAGQVTDAQTGRAISGARVQLTTAPPAFTDFLALRALPYGEHWATLVERPDRTRTAADGHFHFLDLPDGAYTCTATLPGAGSRYGTAQAGATVLRDAAGNLSMVTANLALPPTTVKGQIADQDTADPVFMAEVRVQGSGERAFSNAQGDYLLTGLETGIRTVQVTAQGYQGTSQAVTLEQAGTEQPVHFALVSSAS
jgi:hypothetical protein